MRESKGLLVEVCSLGKGVCLLGRERMIERTARLGWMWCLLEGAEC